MAHADILKIFERMFRSYAGTKIAVWFPNGRNSIRIRHNNKREYIFTYFGPSDWKFETVESFLKK